MLLFEASHAGVAGGPAAGGGEEVQTIPGPDGPVTSGMSSVGSYPSVLYDAPVSGLILSGVTLLSGADLVADESILREEVAPRRATRTLNLICFLVFCFYFIILSIASAFKSNNLSIYPSFVQTLSLNQDSESKSRHRSLNQDTIIL
jgi:hypothetical protein